MEPRNEITQHADMEPQEQAASRDVLHRRPYLGDPLPMRMTAKDMQRAFGIGQARFYVLAKHGTFDRFELLPRIGPRAWSGALVKQYFDGQAVLRKAR